MTLPLFLLPATDKRKQTRKKGSFVFIWRGRVQVRENRASDQEFCGTFFAVTVASASPATVFLAAQTYVFPIFFLFSRGAPDSFYSRICHHTSPLPPLSIEMLSQRRWKAAPLLLYMHASWRGTYTDGSGRFCLPISPSPYKTPPIPYSSTKTGFANFAPCLCYKLKNDQRYPE